MPATSKGSLGIKDYKSWFYMGWAQCRFEYVVSLGPEVPVHQAVVADRRFRVDGPKIPGKSAGRFRPSLCGRRAWGRRG
jgi:hypothetical protein